ncbi:MAG: FHA domain-containing protein [Longimicrobiales bacterium]
MRVLDGAGVLTARMPVEGDQITVGRSYENDVVVEDEFADARHAVVRLLGEGRLEVEDLGSKNGTRVGGGELRRSSAEVRFGTPIEVGMSTITVHAPDDATSEAKSLPGRAQRLVDYSRLPAWTLAGLVVTYITVSTWWSSFEATTGAELVAIFLGIGLLILAWAGAWSLGSRLFSGHARFREHLGFISSVALVVMPVSTVVAWLTFALDSSIVRWFVEWVILGVVPFGVALFGHIDIASSRSRRFKTVFSTAAAVVVVVGLGMLSRIDVSPSVQIQQSLVAVPPVPEALTRSTSLDVFLEEIGSVESVLEAEAKEDAS